MGIYDRNYTQDDYQPQVRYTMPPLTPVVKWLLIINVAVFLVTHLFPPLLMFVETWFSVYPINLAYSMQLWRVITYQFLHGDFGHIIFNMFALFIFGPLLERTWGEKRFLIYYLCCGAAGGILYHFLVWIGISPPASLVGASGAIYGVLVADALLFPNMRVYVLGIFPMPMFVFALIALVFSFVFLMRGNNIGGEAAHLAGMAAGAVYVLWKPWKEKLKVQTGRGAWDKKLKRQADFQGEVDRILDKVSHKGIASLSRKEKDILREATRREQQGR